MSSTVYVSRGIAAQAPPTQPSGVGLAVAAAAGIGIVVYLLLKSDSPAPTPAPAPAAPEVQWRPLSIQVKSAAPPPPQTIQQAPAPPPVKQAYVPQPPAAPVPAPSMTPPVTATPAAWSTMKPTPLGPTAFAPTRNVLTLDNDWYSVGTLWEAEQERANQEWAIKFKAAWKEKNGFEVYNKLVAQKKKEDEARQKKYRAKMKKQI